MSQKSFGLLMLAIVICAMRPAHAQSARDAPRYTRQSQVTMKYDVHSVSRHGSRWQVPLETTLGRLAGVGAAGAAGVK